MTKKFDKSSCSDKIYKQLMLENRLLFFSLRGSRLYGTFLSSSDEDYFGIASLNPRELITTNPLVEDWADEKRDTIVYELRKYLNCIVDNSDPTMLEMLYVPDKFIIHKTKTYDILRKYREHFIVKKCYHSFSGYARKQIEKAKGKNKKIHYKTDFLNLDGIARLKELLADGKISGDWIENRFSKDFLSFLLKKEIEKEIEKDTWKIMDEFLKESDIRSLLPPRKKDFCYVIYDKSTMPGRPCPISKIPDLDLRKCKYSSVEHTGYQYRIYRYSDDYGDIFENNKIRCSSIPFEDEKDRFFGILLFALQEYQSKRKEWRSFWEWMAKRNEDRWGYLDSANDFEYDRKNMLHTLRLIISAKNIAVNGEPIVTFSGESLTFLREIREGRYSYDYLLKLAQDKTDEIKELFEKSDLPEKPISGIKELLYKELMDSFADEFFF